MNYKGNNKTKDNVFKNKNVILSITLIIIIISIFAIKPFSKRETSYESYTIKLDVGDNYKIEYDISDFTWVNSNEEVAFINDSNYINAKKMGTTTISIYDNDKLIYVYTVQVEEKENNPNLEISTLQLLTSEITISVDDSYELGLHIVPNEYDTSKLTWSSSDNNIATVSNGVVTGKKTGYSVVSVNANNGLSSECKVHVIDDIKVESISLKEKNKKIYIDETYQIEVKIIPENSGVGIAYSSSNPDVAAVSNSGLVKGLSEGSSTILVTVGDKEAKFNLEVIKKNKEIVATFNNNGADNIGKNIDKCLSNNNGCKITMPSITRSGYKVIGWSRDKNAHTADYKVGEKVTLYENTAYYAITYKILTATFNSNRAIISKDKETCSVYNFEQNCTVQTPSISRNNYSVLGWGISSDSSNVVAAPNALLSISSSTNYYALTKIHADGIEIGCTGWMAASRYYYSSASVSSSKTGISVGTAFTIEGVEGDFFKVTIPNVSGYKYIQHKYAMINLSDYIPSMTFEIANASSSIYKSSGYNLDGVTGTKLYTTGKVYNIRLGKKEYMAPVLYAVAKKLLIAQNDLRSQGYSIKVYDTYRPRSVSAKIYSALNELYNSNKNVKENILYSYGLSGTRYTWGKNWFLASGVSKHNTGSAIDMTLVYKSNGVEVDMPTPMHELSTKAIKYYSPSVSLIPANYSKEMNDAAKIMDNSATKAGLTTLASEWWHFQDSNAHNVIIGIHGNGCDFSVTHLYSY